MKILAAQINPKIGDINGNKEKIISACYRAVEEKYDLIVFSELVLCGYPPRDLLYFSSFIGQCQMAIDEICELHLPLAILLGTVTPYTPERGRALQNSAVLIIDGIVEQVIHKTLLPSYDVFDEDRYFEAEKSDEAPVFILKGKRFAVTICEDLWFHQVDDFQRGRYWVNPMERLKGQSIDLLINLSASPYQYEKTKVRKTVLSSASKLLKAPVLYVNQVGANDDLIFDGNSSLLNSSADLIKKASAFEEDSLGFDLNASEQPLDWAVSDLAELHAALVLGCKDYMKKTGFQTAVLGMSGGIDSALVLALAVAALGAEKVTAITMPSHFSSSGSVDDSQMMCNKLGVSLNTVSIASIYDEMLSQMKPVFNGKSFDVTEENLQARIRGSLLMAYSNKFGSLLLTTGNKSELSVGYCTLYGDMNGGLSLIGDLPKTLVYELAKYINRKREIIPQAIIDKEPSAELRPEQKDSDSLPPYKDLDSILRLYIEEYKSLNEIVTRGYPLETVEWVIKKVNQNEYKRFQSPPILKVTSKAFGQGRRMPLAKSVFL